MPHSNKVTGLNPRLGVCVCVRTNFSSLSCPLGHHALSWLLTLSQIVDDQVKPGFRYDIDQWGEHLQGPLSTAKHHLWQDTARTHQCVKSSTAVTQVTHVCARRERLQNLRGAYQVVTDKLLSKLKGAGGDVDQILQLGLQTQEETHKTFYRY